MRSVIIIFVQLPVVSNVIPKNIVNATLETHRFNQKVLGSQVAIILHNFFNFSFS